VVVEPELYTVGGGVIPTLLLTFAVERRFTEFDSATPPVVRLLWVPFVSLSLVIGEAAALAGVAGHPNRWFAALVVLAIGFGFWLIVGYFVFDANASALRSVGPDIDAATSVTSVAATGLAGGCGTMIALVAGFAPMVLALVAAVAIIVSG
jgi:hypothetical protein